MKRISSMLRVVPIFSSASEARGDLLSSASVETGHLLASWARTGRDSFFFWYIVHFCVGFMEVSRSLLVRL